MKNSKKLLNRYKTLLLVLVLLTKYQSFCQENFPNVEINIDNKTISPSALPFDTPIKLKIISKENFRMYFGEAYMYEEEKSDVFNVKDYNHRASSYLSFSANTNKSNLEITNTIYFQPLYSALSDYRILQQLQISVPLSKVLGFNTTLNYYHDSETPSGNSQFSTNISAGLSVTL